MTELPVPIDLAALSNITDRMADISTKQARFRGMFYGPSGSGKTVLAQMIMQKIVAPDKGILYIDTSEGWVSIRNHPELLRRTKEVPFTTIEDIRLIGRAIREGVGLYKYIGGIILDEGSSMSQIDTDRLFEVRKRVTKGTRQETNSNTPEWDDYHAALARFRTMNAELFDIPDLHVIIVAHVSDKKDNAGNIINMFPAFSPKIAAKVKEPLHIVGYCTSDYAPNPATDVVNYSRAVQVHPTKMYDAKTRLPITALTVPSELMPGIIKNWLDAGGVEVEHTDIPEEDAVPNPLAGKTPEEAIIAVDEATEGGMMDKPEPADEVDPDFISIDLN